MKYIVTFFLLAVVCTLPAGATTHTITASGFTFVPNAITISVGDTVVFSLSSSHNAVEVSQATWNANGTTSNGGFSVPFGGGTVVFSTPGIRYYVCTPHASLGMKGTITVNEVTAVGEGKEALPASFQLLQNYPNPFNPVTTFRFTIPGGSPQAAELTVSDMLGRRVATIVSGSLPAGAYERSWDAGSLSSGTYLYQLRVGDAVMTRKLQLVR